MIGETFSHYRVLEQLGGGAMGVVYKAQDTRLKRLVALKFLPQELTRNEDAKRRFVQEAEAASALDHPHVCTIFDIDETADGRVFIAMAFYEGETLKHKIQRGPLPVDTVISLAEQVASALQAAHDAGIVHRDVKPANVMVTNRGEAKLLDFGIAKLAGQADLTQTGSSVGTIAYMAPEQFEGQVDGRADIWALGVVIYELLTGRRPFEGGDHVATMNAVFHHTPGPVSSLRPDTPAALAKIVERALQKKAAHRYTSAAEMADELTACRPQSATPATPTPTWRTVLRPAVSVPIILVVGALAYLLLTTLVAQSRARWAREVAIPEIMRLFEADAYAQAYSLTQEAEKFIPNDPALSALRGQITAPPPFVVTKPATARVYGRPYASAENDWQLLGTGSLQGVRLPRGVYRLRAEAEGFDTLELARVTDPNPNFKPVPIELPERGALPPGMVPVPGSRAPVDLTGFATEDPVNIEAFAIGKYEVTNRQFKEFVDAGGYNRRELWKHQIVKDGRAISWDEAMRLFRDSSGRPGPSTWEVGSYREGLGDHPVSGVSWYEAAAYAEFRGASLPTIYHWARAALGLTRAAPIRGVIVKASNFSGNAPLPVGSTGALGPFGTYDMAGNVREWCINESGANRWILGGGVGGDEHMYVVPYAAPPLDRSDNNGFRLAHYMTPGKAAALAAPIDVFRRDFRTVRPVSDEMFAVFKRQLTPVPAPPEAKVESTDTSAAEWTREVVSIDTGFGERMRLIMFIPKGGAVRHHAVIVYPGLGPFQNGTPNDIRALGSGFPLPDFVVKSGRILVFPVWKGSWERFDGFISLSGDRFLQAFRQHMRDWCQETSQVLDYLASRPDVDPAGFAYWGASFGASTMLPVLAVEPRFKTAVLGLAGFTYRALLPEIEAVNFVSRITIPVLMLEGRYDHLFPMELSQLPMYKLLGSAPDQKRIVHFDAGHGALPRGQVISESLNWLDKFLGPSN